MFVKHGCPRRQQSRNMAKISKSYILTPPHPQGHVMSVKCEQPIDELTVQVWLLYHNPNFKYRTLFVSGTGRDGITDGQTDKRTNRRTDDPNTRCPRRTFQAGGIKTQYKILINNELAICHNKVTCHITNIKKDTYAVPIFSLNSDRIYIWIITLLFFIFVCVFLIAIFPCFLSFFLFSFCFFF